MWIVVLLGFALGTFFGIIVIAVLSASEDIWDKKLRQIEEEEDDYVDWEQGTEQGETER